jgi:hypothetical protein
MCVDVPGKIIQLFEIAGLKMGKWFPFKVIMESGLEPDRKEV